MRTTIHRSAATVASLVAAAALALTSSPSSHAALTVVSPGDEVDYPGCVVSLRLSAAARLPHPVLSTDGAVAEKAAPSVGVRPVRSAADAVDEVPVHVLDELTPGDAGQGPAIIEGPFFTARVLPLEHWLVDPASILAGPRRSTDLTRSASSRGLNGLVT